MQVKKHQLQVDMQQWLVQNWARSTSRLYTVILLINLYAEYIMWNARLDESQIRIKIARRNINNFRYAGASLVALRVKCLPTMRETWIRYLGQEDRLEKEMATHSSSLAWKIPWTEKPGRLQSMGSQRVGHDWVTSLSLSDMQMLPL